METLSPLPVIKPRKDGWFCPDIEAPRIEGSYTCPSCTNDFFQKRKKWKKLQENTGRFQKLMINCEAILEP